MKPAASWLWHSLLGYHLIQFLFYLGRFFPSVNPNISRLSAWLDRNKTITIDESWRVFNLDCKVSKLCLSNGFEILIRSHIL